MYQKSYIILFSYTRILYWSDQLFSWVPFWLCVILLNPKHPLLGNLRYPVHTSNVFQCWSISHEYHPATSLWVKDDCWHGWCSCWDRLNLCWCISKLLNIFALPISVSSSYVFYKSIWIRSTVKLWKKWVRDIPSRTMKICLRLRSLPRQYCLWQPPFYFLKGPGTCT